MSVLGHVYVMECMRRICFGEKHIDTMCIHMYSNYTYELHHIGWVVPPPRMPVAKEGLGWDPYQKYNNPGGDWNPGQGNNPTYKL